jgi:F-type H+-transporting ATPase subunit b
MPQLNPEFWISQIFWLTLTFGILYIVLVKTNTSKNKCKSRIKKISNTRKY